MRLHYVKMKYVSLFYGSVLYEENTLKNIKHSAYNFCLIFVITVNGTASVV
jgi:hypothetical protein